MSRVRELETAQKNEERQKKLAERKKAQELREAKKKLSKELQQAQRQLTKSEQEVNKLNGQLQRTEQQAQQATVKKNREGEKHEEGIGRIRTKHGKVDGVLREKMANVGQARGRLVHVQFALSMLEKGVIIQVGEDHNLPQPASAAAPPQRRRRRVSVGIGEDGQPIEVEEEYDETAEEGDPHTEGEETYLTADMREEFEQLKEENRRLREHLADSDQRCVTAVQLLQQAQDVLESRGGMDTSELKLRMEEKPLELTMETASTMHSSREESCQPSPTAPLDARPATQPALHVQPPNLPAAPMGPMPMLGPDGLPLPNLLGGQRPTEKRIFYAGSTLGPNRMVSGPPLAGMPNPFGYQPMQLPQDHTMPQPLGATLLASASTPAIRPMKMPLGQEPVAVPAMRQPMPAEPLMPLR